ncbi:MAG: CHAT domain-containing protein [Bacteroidales bacterium]|nr:CHAT domain-containing protein [Bacteroidales bacterium]MCF8389464.1 CHAT domain-containing protein [Bacteroidales bacterium]
MTGTSKHLIEEGYYYEASSNLKQAIDLIQIHQSENLIKLSANHQNLAIAFIYVNKYDDALFHIQKAEEILKQIDINHVRIGSLYGVTAEIYNKMKDFDRSKRYFFQAVETLLSAEKVDYFTLGASYISLSILYSELNDSFNSNYYWEKAHNLFIKYGYDDFNFYSLGYKVFNKFQDEGKVLYYLSKMEDEKVNKESFKLTNKLILNNLYADYYTNYKFDYHTALSYYKKNLTLILNTFSEDHPLSIDIFSILSRLYYETGNYSNSIEFASRIIKNIDIDLSLIETDQSLIPEEDFVKFRYLVEPLEYLIKSKYAIFLKTNDLRDLNDAYKHSFYLTKVLDNLRWQYDNQSAEYIVGGEDADKYKMGQMLAGELYSITKDEKYIDEAFEFNERAKGFNLLANLRTQSAMDFGGIPKELLEREADLNQKISTYKELIHGEEQLEIPDDTKINNWQKSLFNVSIEYDDLIKFFEENYPDYYNLKYNEEVISIRETAESLGKNDVILEYSMKDSILFTYVISPKTKKLYQQVVDSSFRKDCMEFYNVITTQSFSHDVGQTFRNYTRLGHDLYSTLIAPIKEELKDKNVIVIPDQEISYIPFEALLSEKVNPDKVDYYRLPYLLKENGFSSSYSSTIHFMKAKETKKSLKNILAFAPSYSNLSSQNAGFQLLRQSDVKKLIRIPGVKEEVNKISQILDVDIYQDMQASESTFKKLAPDYRILHLAMHTILDDEKPLYSKLAFTQLVDTLNDGLLHTYEIYNMQINADLAVLSSCSSGFGNLKEGEGFQSLARAFTYAGCPSILMTLWEVADNSTVDLMERFYYYLGKGFSKGEALRRSKLDFLSVADQLKSNPFFWSSFVIIGETDPVYPSEIKTHILNFGILMIPFPILLLFFLRYRKQEEEESLKNKKD